MNNETANQTQPQQQQPRLPKISPKFFEALNVLDGHLGKAPLTRQEHAVSNQCMQTLMMGLEALEGEVAHLKSENGMLQQQLETARNSDQACKVVPAVIDQVERDLARR